MTGEHSDYIHSKNSLKKGGNKSDNRHRGPMTWDPSVIDRIGNNILQSATDAIIVIDAMQNIIQFNTSAEQVFGYKKSEVLGRSINILLPKHLRKSHQAQVQHYGETGKTTRTMHSLGVLTGLRANEEIFPIEASIAQTLVDGQRFYAVILRDISERENLENLILKQYESLNTLHLITLGLLNRRNIKELLQFIVDETVKLLEVSYCEILLPDGDELVAQAFSHKDPFEEGNRFNRTQGSLSWRVFDSGIPIILDDYANWPERHNIYEEQDFHAAAAMPLFVDDQCIGVLGLTRNKTGHAFSEEEILTATRLSAIAALAIENSRLYREVEKMASVDELTGMHNRRSILSIGEVELQRAIRYNRPLSVLMLDIDHFKKVNDTWGHPAGDVVLKRVAQEVLLRIRKMDAIGRIDLSLENTGNIIGRLGGEEFGILLPETSPKQAWIVAERLRSNIEKLRINVPSQKRRTGSLAHIHVSASIGVASVNPATNTLADLLADADKALYIAKESGRNRVQLSIKSKQPSIETTT